MIITKYEQESIRNNMKTSCIFRAISEIHNFLGFDLNLHSVETIRGQMIKRESERNRNYGFMDGNHCGKQRGRHID